jgi:predicted dehydrogenase
MRLGVLGLGFMGATHIRALDGIDGLTLAAISSSDPKKLAGDLSGVGGNLGAAFATLDFSNVAKHTRWQDIIADDSIDAVDVCLPTHLHAEATEMALNAGKHVLCEKPLALDFATADRLVALAKERGKVLMAAQVLRFFPMYRQMAERVKSGTLGAVRAATFRRRCAAPPWAKWMQDKSISGGGVFDLLIHDVDMALHLFGVPSAVSATGREALDSYVDTINAQLYYDGLDSVTVAGGWHHGAFPFSMEYTIVADGGTIEYSSASGKDPQVYRPGAEAEALTPVAAIDGYQEEIRYFYECCRDGCETVYCSPAESAQAVKVTRLMSEARRQKGEKCPL